MANGTTLWWPVLLFLLECGVYQPPAIFDPRVEANHVQMLVMRKADAEFRDKLAPFPRRIDNVTQTRKQPATGVARTYRNMAVRTNKGRRSLARKELLPVTTQTGGVFGKISYIGKGSIALAHFLPILRRNLMTGITSELLSDGMGLMRKLRIVDPRCLGNFALRFLRSRFLRPPLRFNPARACSGSNQKKHQDRRDNDDCRTY